ncbi:hypothetical protein Tco_1409098 [Tanacetum coccineum]
MGSTSNKLIPNEPSNEGFPSVLLCDSPRVSLGVILCTVSWLQEAALIRACCTNAVIAVNFIKEVLHMLSFFNSVGRCTWSKSRSYIAYTLANKPMRRCEYCGKYAYHDARNCPERKKLLGHDMYQVVFKDVDVYYNE